MLKVSRILLTGQCTVHWGRMEFGNVGNFYIIETTVRELHRVFPAAELVTTFQMTDEFSKREKITCLPMSLFYSWCEDDLQKALNDYSQACFYKETGAFVKKTPYIEELLKCDLILDFSGEMWGDHAEPVGKNRFLIGLLKNRTAQLLGKPVVLLAGTQGPFSKKYELEFAKVVLKDMSLVSNRESASIDLLRKYDFDVTKVKNFTDPAFLFEPANDSEMKEIYVNEKIVDPVKRTVGIIICGFNMLEGPYDKWPRRDDEFIQFVKLVEYLVSELGTRVVLFSHQNGFELPPNFKLINGRDYPYAKKLYDLVKQRGNVDIKNVVCINKPYLPNQIKAIIKHFDIFVTGRIHAFVAAVSQHVPTVIITRGHGLTSHRNIGFARSAGLEDYISDPHSFEDMQDKVYKCWVNRVELRKTLEKHIPVVKKQAHALFDSLLEVVSEE